MDTIALESSHAKIVSWANGTTHFLMTDADFRSHPESS